MWWRHEAVCGLPFYISKTAYVVCVSFCICPKPGVAIITMCGADHGNEKNRQNPILPQGIFRRRPFPKGERQNSWAFRNPCIYCT